MNLFDMVDAMNPLASRTDQLKRFFKTIYDRIDTDKSNYLDQAELSAAIEKLARHTHRCAEATWCWRGHYASCR